MSANIVLRENASGEVRIVRDETPYDYPENLQWCWEEGNYSCDCNRLLLFVRAGGEEEPDFEALVCGEGAFTVLEILPEEQSNARFSNSPACG